MIDHAERGGERALTFVCIVVIAVLIGIFVSVVFAGANHVAPCREDTACDSPAHPSTIQPSYQLN